MKRPHTAPSARSHIGRGLEGGLPGRPALCTMHVHTARTVIRAGGGRTAERRAIHSGGGTDRTGQIHSDGLGRTVWQTADPPESRPTSLQNQTPGRRCEMKVCELWKTGRFWISSLLSRRISCRLRLSMGCRGVKRHVATDDSVASD